MSSMLRGVSLILTHTEKISHRFSSSVDMTVKLKSIATLRLEKEMRRAHGRALP